MRDSGSGVVGMCQESRSVIELRLARLSGAILARPLSVGDFKALSAFLKAMRHLTDHHTFTKNKDDGQR